MEINNSILHYINIWAYLYILNTVVYFGIVFGLPILFGYPHSEISPFFPFFTEGRSAVCGFFSFSEGAHLGARVLLKWGRNIHVFSISRRGRSLGVFSSSQRRGRNFTVFFPSLPRGAVCVFFLLSRGGPISLFFIFLTKGGAVCVLFSFSDGAQLVFFSSPQMGA